MNGFHDFDNFRVGAWMDEGVMIRLENAAQVVRQTVKKVVATVATAAAAGAFVAASVLSVPVTAAASPVVPSVATVVTGSSLADELDRMAASIDRELDKLPELSVASVDKNLLSLARAALAASDARRTESPSKIAEKFFANSF